jgi:hypothetical protein
MIRVNCLLLTYRHHGQRHSRLNPHFSQTVKSRSPETTTSKPYSDKNFQGYKDIQSIDGLERYSKFVRGLQSLTNKKRIDPAGTKRVRDLCDPSDPNLPPPHRCCGEMSGAWLRDRQLGAQFHRTT